MSNDNALVASAYLEVSDENDAIWITDIRAVMKAVSELSMESRGQLFTDALEIMRRNSETRASEAAARLVDDETNVITLNLNNPFVRSMFESLHSPACMQNADRGEVVK